MRHLLAAFAVASTISAVGVYVAHPTVLRQAGLLLVACSTSAIVYWTYGGSPQ